MESKNARRSHMEKTKEEKKSGNGKGNWGKLVDVYDPSEERIDPSDPLYEEEMDVEVPSQLKQEARIASKLGIRDSSDAYMSTSTFKVSMPLPEFKTKSIEIINEFLTNDDVIEAQASLEELKSPGFHYEFVKKAVTVGMDKKERQREKVSRLLSDLYLVLTMDDVGKGFERLLEDIDDLSIDTPDAKGVLAKFIARAIVDEILPPRFLNDPLVLNLASDVVKESKEILIGHHGVKHIENVWGPGAEEAIVEIKKLIDQTIEEYFLSFDVAEAVRCLKELDIYYYHHEVVKRVIVSGVYKEEHFERCLTLLKKLADDGIVTERQLNTGFQRALVVLPDMALDVPSAKTVMTKMIVGAVRMGLIPDTVTV
eukprot:TRINITY_DN779991_c0_g1_i1.p1 TRINITY_DN779991_c0_g1~~TRINITY_DN779991_c0_g1_i1.p1  ORF type:complete len:369 (-),score=135.14 TRINITY_DN779991_c0_g1_i1:159-1265(-)